MCVEFDDCIFFFPPVLVSRSVRCELIVCFSFVWSAIQTSTLLLRKFHLNFSFLVCLESTCLSGQLFLHLGSSWLWLCLQSEAVNVCSSPLVCSSPVLSSSCSLVILHSLLSLRTSSKHSAHIPHPETLFQGPYLQFLLSCVLQPPPSSKGFLQGLQILLLYISPRALGCF